MRMFFSVLMHAVVVAAGSCIAGMLDLELTKLFGGSDSQAVQSAQGTFLFLLAFLSVAYIFRYLVRKIRGK